MEDPQERTTNFHQLEGVLFVQWTTYTFVEVETSQLDQHDVLENAAADLRKDAHYALYDRSHLTLWHFVPSGPEVAKDPNATRKSSHAFAIISRYNLQRITSGSLRATDVSEAAINFLDDTNDTDHRSVAQDASKSMQFASYAGLGRPDALGMHGSGFAQTSQETLQIYGKVLIALEKTVSCVVSLAGHWMPVAPGVYTTRTPAEVDKRFENLDAGGGVQLNRLTRLRACWLFSGNIIMFSFPYPSHMLTEDRLPPMDNNEATNQTKLLVVAPLGVVFYGLRTMSFEAEEYSTGDDDASRWRDFVLKWLSRQGILLTASGSWTLLRRPDGTRAQRRTFAPPISSTTFIWPSELCLSINYPRTARSKDAKEPGPIRDLLVEAEEWVMNREQRKARAETDQTSQLQDITDDEMSSEEDDFIHLLPRNDNMLDVQAMTGIYPTPPDAPRPQVLPTGDDRNDQSIFNTEARTPLDAETRTPKVAFEDRIETDGETMMTEPFDHIEEDDLFGNMSGDEYNNNGVTEDDFSFFDEPGDTPAAIDMLGATPHPTDHVDDLVLPSSADVQNAIAREDLIESTISTPDRPEHKHEEGNQRAIAAHDPNLEEAPRAASSYTGNVLATTPADSYVKGAGDAFATKYGQKGKFSADGPTRHSAVPGQGPHIQNSIPSIPTPHDDTDSEEEDSDRSDMMADLRQSLPEIDVLDSEDEPPAKMYHQSIKIDDSNVIEQEDDLEEFYMSVRDKPEEFLLYLQRNSDLKPKGEVPRSRGTKPPDNVDGHIRLAQIFSDQLVHRIDAATIELVDRDSRKAETSLKNDFAGQAMQLLFPRGSCCSLRKLANLCEDGMNPSPLKRSTSNLPLKRVDTGKMENVSTSATITAVHPPNMRTKRGDKQMQISYTALRFWEELGLSPFAGAKNTVAFCIFPDQEVVRRGAQSFLTMMKSTYTSLRLGTHHFGHPAMKGYRDGLAAVARHDYDTDELLNKSCERLGRALQTLSSLRTTIVVYMVNDRDQGVGIKRLCHAFLKLFEAYVSNLRFTASATPSDIVLKVVPMDWIASSWTIAMPSVADLVGLSKEIYNRCPQDDENASPYASHSLIEIAESIPKSLDFKLTYESLANPFHKETFAHVAYCWDSNSMWLNASLTDTLGCHSWSAVFLVGQTVADQRTTFAVVAKEICEIVHDSVADVHGKVKMLIYKDGSYSEEEKATWAATCRAESYVLLQIDETPPIMLSEDDRPLPQFDPNQIPDKIPSTPDVPTADNNPLKPEELDPHARAVDLDEEAWAVVMSRSFDQDKNRDARALLAHGYLIKKNKAVLGLRVVSNNGEVDVRELLAINQGLICLAKARGLRGELPWHMAVARRGHDGMVGY